MNLISELQAKRYETRKLRLLACGFANQIPLWDEAKTAVGFSERLADGETAWEDATLMVRRLLREKPENISDTLWAFGGQAALTTCYRVAVDGAMTAARAFGQYTASLCERSKAQNGVGSANRAIAWATEVELFNCVFGPQIVWRSEWMTTDAVELAESIYVNRTWGMMPVLGDALEDAGCVEEVLKHCRAKVLHTRGCWVVDLICDRR